MQNFINIRKFVLGGENYFVLERDRVKENEGVH